MKSGGLLVSLIIVLAFEGIVIAPAMASAAIPKIISPPPGKLYHGVYPGGRTGEENDVTPADLQSYVQAVGKTVAWVYFSNNWYRDRQFPLSTAGWIRDGGSVPFIRLMLRDGPEQGVPNQVFTLDRIIQGFFDGDLRAWATGARDFGSPLLVEYGTEVNGWWFPWNGQWNGGGNMTGYGNSTYPDGPERFRDAYRHIIDVVRGAGASNIMWVFHVNSDDSPTANWNRFEMYYPGDGYIDWLGLSAYGAQTPMDDSCNDFQSAVDGAYQRLVTMAPGKPVVVLEFGVTSGNPLCDQAVWAREALGNLTGARWPAVIGFSWWNEAWQNDENPNHKTDMRVQDNPALGGVFRTLVGANPNILGRVILSETQGSENQPTTTTTEKMVQTGSSRTSKEQLLSTSNTVAAIIFSVILATACSAALYTLIRRPSRGR